MYSSRSNVVKIKDPRGAVGGKDAASRFEPVQLGHADVHQNDGGMKACGLVDRLQAITRLGDNLNVVLAG